LNLKTENFQLLPPPRDLVGYVAADVRRQTRFLRLVTSSATGVADDVRRLAPLES
jgi:hypothetical protein